MPALSKKIEKLLNEQVEKEMYSSHLYLAMSAWCDSKGLHGSTKFLYKQSVEETEHAHKLMHYIQEAGGTVVVPAVKQPPARYDSFLKVFETVYLHEQGISEAINKLVEACLTAKDYTSFNLLQWYVAEQLEEENQFRTILDKIRMAGSDSRGIYMMDKELGKIVERAAG